MEISLSRGVVYHRGGMDISQIGRFGDMSDEIIGMAVICEYTFQPGDISNYCIPRFLALGCQQHPPKR
jgi:hypothetical protein